MTTTLNWDRASGRDGDARFNILMACEDTATTRNALALYQRLAQRLARQFQFAKRLWKLEKSAAPAAEESALLETGWADMIIVALHREDRPLPAPVCNYLETCARDARREAGLMPAVVALFDETPDPSDAPCAREYLRSVTSQGGMDLFIHGAGTPENVTILVATPEADSTGPPRPEAPQDVHQRWGINE